MTNIDCSRIKEELDQCANPLFFFDDDPDGLCSFLLLYRYKREGHGIIVKAKPYLSIEFLRKVEEYQPDKIFVLDIPNISIVPTSYMCYQAVQQDMWIAMLGCIGDWFIPDFTENFCTKYPFLAEKCYATPPEFLFKTNLGNMIRLFSFNLKGKIDEANKAIKILSRIKSPEEIISQKTAQAKYLVKKYETIKKVYDQLKETAINEEKKNTKNPFLLYLYEENKISLTKDLSNELLYLFPTKVIILGRAKSGEVKCSLRSAEHKLDQALAKALIGIQGYGGGHEHACGCCIKEEDFPRFLKALQTALDL
ncbi:DHH family phosphoesterase [Candidatus Woesearchaeota archaeon]|nr:DHH family phosphoesterase [Candidatus Woesearchaeota archaeon]